MTRAKRRGTDGRRALWTALLLGAATGASGCAGAGVAAQASPPAPAIPAATPRTMLAPERVAALPPAERSAWTRYLEISRQARAADRAAIDAELRALGRDSLVSAPRGPALVLHDSMTEAWFGGAHARRVADHILSYQTPSGGWSKRLDFVTRARLPGESFSSERWGYVATFDNDATTEPLRFLARVFRAQGEARHREAFLRGLDYVVRAQFPNGCWPQVYPLQGGYNDAATYNDDAMVRVLRLLREVGGAGYAWVPQAERERAAAALARGLDCVLRSQVVVDGRRTVWGAQHDPLTLQPVQARAYEHASLSGRESAAVVLFLMEQERPDARVVEAVRGAVDWFNATAIHGYEYAAKGGLVARPGAGPLWARFYELGTNRPIFSNRDGVVRYRWDELEDERKFGYAWYTDEPLRILRRYDRWQRRLAGPGQ